VTPVRSVAVALLVVVLALMAAGCTAEGERPAVEWADGLCSAIVTWREDLRLIANRFDDPSSLDRESFEDAASDAVDETEEFIDELRDLGRPDTEAGEAAEEALDELSDELETSLDRIAEEIENASGLPGTIESVANIVGELGEMGVAVDNAYTMIRAQDVSGELRTAFEQAESCDELT
jgi:hypothetical protein